MDKESMKRVGHFRGWSSDVVEGERHSPESFLGECLSPNDIRTRGNGDTVAFHQRNAKSMVKVCSSFVNVECLISYFVRNLVS